MVLLNLMRVLVTLIAMFILETFRRAWSVEGPALLVLLAFMMMIAFCVADVIEAWLIAYFDKEEDEKGTAN